MIRQTWEQVIAPGIVALAVTAAILAVPVGLAFLALSVFS